MTPNEFIAGLAMAGFWDDYCPDCDAQTPHDEGECQICVEGELVNIINQVLLAEREPRAWIYIEEASGRIHATPPENVPMRCRRVTREDFERVCPGEPFIPTEEV